MSATWAERIVRALNAADRPMNDDELAARLGASQRQTINQTCRRLEREGTLLRHPGPDGKIVNALTDSPRPAQSPPILAGALAASELLGEDQVKAAVKASLEAEGWRVEVAWGHARGVDIAGTRGTERLFLEAKGAAANPPQQVNYFLGALGELVQRMDDAQAQYGLALPDNRQYRGLADRLPPLARERLGLVIAFVSPEDRSVCWQGRERNR